MHVRPVLLALGLSSFALAACGGDDDSGPAAPAATAAAPAPTTTAAVTTAAGATPTTEAKAGGDDYGTPATDAATATSAATGDATVAVATADTSLGTIVVDGEGMALYLFENDTDGKSTCYDACATAWPPLLSTGSDTAGAGIDESKLGTVARDDGTEQVTYAGKPLYYFAGDRVAGDTNGQGVNDVWYVLDADGTKIGGS